MELQILCISVGMRTPLESPSERWSQNWSHYSDLSLSASVIRKAELYFAVSFTLQCLLSIHNHVSPLGA
ncbi:hypothetical protein Y1Q_0008022 [Alligator mississippiensis]|uniref:Uncharacterized protein n=1 Tax=Alligator mississippiensis TaxID=8496 RepID=A0A151NF79_ALLMI|nr:hypothetical protein Y1Q_0008022 [Alligator mississippiensis]